jgi:hypothetical protein
MQNEEGTVSVYGMNGTEDKANTEEARLQTVGSLTCQHTWEEKTLFFLKIIWW